MKSWAVAYGAETKTDAREKLAFHRREAPENFPKEAADAVGEALGLMPKFRKGDTLLVSSSGALDKDGNIVRIVTRVEIVVSDANSESESD
jgi:hypothetical protein